MAPGVTSKATAGFCVAAFGAGSFRGASALRWRGAGGVFAKTRTVGEAARFWGGAGRFLRADVARAKAPSFVAACSASRDASSRCASRAAKAQATLALRVG